jgi:hypothetical protein
MIYCSGMDNNRRYTTDLAADFGSELIGVNEFAALLGLDSSTAAQLRAERKRDQSGFPAVVSESGRTFLHRLEDLITWIEASRFGSIVAAQPSEVASWRLERLMRTVVEQVGVVPARRLLAALALDATQQDLTKESASARANLAERLLQDLPDETASASKRIANEFGRDTVDIAAVDRVLVELGSHQPGIPNRTDNDIARLAALILDTDKGDVVYEPTSGECEILLRVAELATQRNKPLHQVAGSDDDIEASLIGEARLRLAGVDAIIGPTPNAGSVNRLIIDPGWSTDRRHLARWTRLLHRDGRAIVITKIAGFDPDLLAELPPSTIIFPPQRPPTAQGATVLWVSEPFRDEPGECNIIDLRKHTAGNELPIQDQLGIVSAALNLQLPPTTEVAKTAKPSQGDQSAMPPRAVVVPFADLEDALEPAIAGTLGFPPEVVEDNRQYALELAQELERLIGGRDHNTPTEHVKRPNDSPNGVLASKTTDEARRVVADALAGVRQWNRRQGT